MTILELAGCALTAYGPSLSMFILTVSHDPIRIIILVASAFFWLVALLAASLVWNFVTFTRFMPLCIVVSVIIQEVFRYGIYLLLRKAEQGLRGLRVPDTNIDVLKNRQVVPYVAGLGYGLMSGAFSAVNVLAALAGPGTVGLTSGSDSTHYFPLFTALFTTIMTLLHTFWSVIFFAAVDSRNFLMVSWVIFSHLFVSLMTLLNSSFLYFYSLSPAVLVLLLTAYLAYKVVSSPHPLEVDS